MAITDWNTFETSLSGWNVFASSAVSPAHGQDDSQSVRFSTRNSYISKLETDALNHAAYIWFCPRSAPVSPEKPGFQLHRNSSQEFGWVLNPDMTLSLRRAGSIVMATSAFALTAGIGYRIGLKHFSNSTTGTAVLTVDGTTIISFTGNTVNVGQPNAVAFGHLTGIAPGVDQSASAMDFDNFAIGDSLSDGDPFNELSESEIASVVPSGRTSLSSGVLYEMSQDLYDDDGCEIRRVRRSSPLSAEQEWMFFQRIKIMLETGKGLNSGQGSDPKIMLRWSDDGGETWSPEFLMTAGKIGEYRAQAQRRGLGRSRNRVFEIAMSDPIKWAILDGFIDFTA